MKNKIEFEEQFHLNPDDYLAGIDLSNWFRYYNILKEIISFSPRKILEVGAGNEVVKNCLKNFVEDYRVIDINSKLKPDVLADLREFRPEMKEKFDCVICADVLEHMPFKYLEKNLANIRDYLNHGGKAMITIPHRRARLMIITPFSYKKPVIIGLPSWLKSSFKSFYRQIIKGKIHIDPHHCWEIGDGTVKIKDVEEVIKKVGFNINKFDKLLHVDFWVLDKI